MPQGYVDQGFRKKSTYVEILFSIERDEDKIQLPERTAFTFWDSFAMDQYKEMLENYSKPRASISRGTLP